MVESRGWEQGERPMQGHLIRAESRLALRRGREGTPRDLLLLLGDLRALQGKAKHRPQERGLCYDRSPKLARSEIKQATAYFITADPVTSWCFPE